MVTSKKDEAHKINVISMVNKAAHHFKLTKGDLKITNNDLQLQINWANADNAARLN